VKKTTLCSVYSLVLVCGNNDTDGKQVMLMLMHIPYFARNEQTADVHVLIYVHVCRWK